MLRTRALDPSTRFQLFHAVAFFALISKRFFLQTLLLFFTCLSLLTANNPSIDSLLELTDDELYLVTDNPQLETGIKELAGKILLNRSMDQGPSVIKIAYQRLLYIAYYEVSAASYLDSFLHYSLLDNDRELISYGYLTRAGMNYEKFQVEEALINLDLAYSYCDDKNSLLWIDINHTKGLLKNYVNDEKEALEIFEKNMKFFETSESKTENPESYIVSLFAYAESLSRNGLYKKSIHFSELGMAESETLNLNNYYSNFLLVYGSSKVQLKEYEEAIAALKAGISDVKNEKALYVSALVVLLEAYVANKDKDNAEQILAEVDSLYNDDKTLIYSAHRAFTFISNLYKELGEETKELIYIRKAVKLDSILSLSIGKLGKGLVKLDMERQTNNNYLYILLATGTSLLFYLLVIGWMKIKSKGGFSLSSALLESSQEIEKQYGNENEISDAVYNSIVGKLNEFEKEQLFLNPACSLNGLAKAIRTNTTYLSKVINKEKNMNFSAYISLLRIDYCLGQLSKDSDWSYLTIEGIAKNSGFKSYRSFSKAL